MDGNTPKQQVTEALRSAETVVITTSSKADSDQIASTIALSQMMDKLGKRPEPVYSGEIPSNLSFLPTNILHKQFNGLRDFIIELDTSKTEADKLKYVPEGKRLKVYITPFNGNFNKEDLRFSYGDYHCDAVIMVGAKNATDLDKAVSGQKQLLEKTRLISIMAGAGSDNKGNNQSQPQTGGQPANPGADQLPKQISWHEPLASSVSEMLMSLTEALQPGLLDNHIATSLLTGIVGATDHFTAANTTPKVMTMAAQLMAAGADQGSIIKHLEKPLPKPESLAPTPKPQQPPKPQTPDRELRPSQEKSLPHHEMKKPTETSDEVRAGKPELPKPEAPPSAPPPPPPVIHRPKPHEGTPANPNPPPKFPGANEPAHITGQPVRSIPPHPPQTPVSTTFPPASPPLPQIDASRPLAPPLPNPTPPTPSSQPEAPAQPAEQKPPSPAQTSDEVQVGKPTLDVDAARRAVEEATRDLPQQ